jgi:ribosome biogenesis GTPase
LDGGGLQYALSAPMKGSVELARPPVPWARSLGKEYFAKGQKSGKSMPARLPPIASIARRQGVLRSELNKGEKQIDLLEYGLNSRVTREAEKYGGMEIGRVAREERGSYRVATQAGEMEAAVTGRFRYEALALSDYPAVGDWVMIQPAGRGEAKAAISVVLPRKSAFTRLEAGGRPEAQIVASNIDKAFLAMGLDQNFNLRRMERYLAAAWKSGAVPIVLLTKADACEDLKEKAASVADISSGAEICISSSFADGGWLDVASRIEKGETAAFIGPSGVGKSTLINRLLGQEALATGGVRKDGRGRHTTTSRQMLLLSNGGVVIDTPGLRELKLDMADVPKTFEDIDSLALTCRFRDCTHTVETGCAVLGAIESGELAQARLDSYRKLLKEASYEGLSSRMLEQEKINRLFGSKAAMKSAMKAAKSKRGKR